MLAMTELHTTSDAMHREAAPSVVLAPRLQVLPSLSETAARPQVARPSSRPAVDEDDFDSMWEEGVASW
jgi:hypothetical protein